MAEAVTGKRDWFAPLMTLATVVVAVCSLYYSSVQADVARKTFEINCNEVHAGLQKDIADLQKHLAAGSTDRNLADLLNHLADLQLKLAEQQRRAAIAGSSSLADVQQQMGEVQKSLARLKKEQEHKDQEIASLRASLTAAQKPPVTSPLLSGTGSVPFPLVAKDPFLPFSKLNVPRTWNFQPMPALQAKDESFSSRVNANLLDIWSIFCKYPGPSVYFVLAALLALAKLFGRK